MNKLNLYIIFLCLVFFDSTLHAQESIFNGLKSDLKKANDFYEDMAYHDAVQLYTLVADEQKGNVMLHLKIANCYYMMNNMELAVAAYSKFVRRGGKLNQAMKLRYANCLQATGNYNEAIVWFQKYLEKKPKDHEISLRVWRLQNINYLYYDSVFYTVNRLDYNTKNDEICPAIYGNSIVFASNRATAKPLNRVDANNKPFFSWYISIPDSLQIGKQFNEDDMVDPFGGNIYAKYHKSSICFYPNNDKMVFARTGNSSSKDEGSTTQIFFAGKDGKYWKETEAFLFNSTDYSVNHPMLCDQGKTMFFSSDMPGGMGGMDIYKTKRIDGKWSEPENVGDEINTSQDEKYPHLHHNTLYFTSNGQPGFGGFDMFMADMNKEPLNVTNMGFPVNTYFDDFGLILDKAGTTGYFVSNRDNQTINDDIFEVHISRPSYPLTVSGKIKYKITQVNDSTTEMNKLAFAHLELIDNENKTKVQETQSDADGSFAIEIPYEGQFMLSIAKKDFGIAVVSMHIPRNPKDYLNHDIVIVKDLFKLSKESESNFLTKPSENPSLYDQ